MVSVISLWLPILVSTVFVFIASNLIWMVLQLHKNESPTRQDRRIGKARLGKQNLKRDRSDS